ncbi:MAG: hypothetical protein AAF849_18050 [Bacteroidota bacterium]
MKNIFLLLLFGFFSFSLSAQEQVDEYLADAKSSYDVGNLEDTRFALQQSLNELYVLISKEILAALPDQLGAAKAVSEGDQYNGALMGYSGVFVDRTYEHPDQDQSVQVALVHDSPLMSGIGSFLASPVMSMATGRKRVKIDGYKAALEESEGMTKEYTFYIPFDQSLITLTFNGYDNETEVIGLANQLPIAKVVSIAK